ncbi:hypothetical protein KAR91_33060 [Candidatus Pacearchaeota archaeon]|nr:hypothetical protein [Candidatus Pacearchaeota archaeon]
MPIIIINGVVQEAAGGGGGGTDGNSLEPNPQYDAGSLDYPTANGAPLDTEDSGANGTIKKQTFDDTTEQFIQRQAKVPSDIDPAGTVTFKAMGFATTGPAAARFIQLKLYHSAKNSGEAWDGAYSNKVSGDLAVDPTAGPPSPAYYDYFEWTETVANLGWTANDILRWMLSRIAPAGTNLTGDWTPVWFEVDIPRT